MPPKPRAGQIRKPAPRRRKPNTINLQLAVGQSMDYAATAVNPGATSAMPLPFLAPMPSSAPAPISDAHMAREYVDLYTILPPPSSHSTSSVLPSPSLTDEASPASAHAPAEPYEQPATATTETAMVLPSTHEVTAYQTTNSQNGAPQRPVQESNQPTREETPLHTAVIWAISVIRQRAEEFKDGKCPANDGEQSRYSTLLNACHSLDAVFLIVHQQCCCWKLDRKAAYAALVPIPPELIDIAFRELCSVFSDDKHMQITDPHWQWFSNFPGFRNVVGLDRIYIQARDFIAAFAMHWPAMKKSLLSQMMPPMAHQIRDILRCVSNTVASALFKRIRKEIGIPDGPMSARLNHLFTMDNRQELNFEEQSVPQEEIDRVRSTMMATYVNFVRETREEQARLPEVGAVSAAPAANASHRIPPLPSSNHANINADKNINRLAAPPQQQPPSQGPLQCQAPDAVNHQPHAAPPQPSHQRPQHLEESQPAVHPPTQPAANFQNQPQPPQPRAQLPPQPQQQPQILPSQHPPQPQQQPQSQFPPQPRPQPQPQFQHQSQHQVQHQPQLPPQHQPQLEPEPQHQPQPQLQHNPQPPPQPQSQSQHQHQSQSEEQPQPQPQPQPQSQPQSQQSGLRYPTGVIHCQQASHPSMAPKPRGQPVPEHSNLLPPIIPPQNETEPRPPTAMPQQQPSPSYGPPPPHNYHQHPHHPHQTPHHQGHPHQGHPYQHQYQHHDPRYRPHNHGQSPSLDGRPMQHPSQTMQVPLPSPWPREQQVQTQGSDSRQYQTPPPLPNSPYQHLSHPHHHHHMPPGQVAQAPQLPSASHALQAPWTPQPHQVSRTSQLQMAPQPFMTPQHHQIHHAAAQMLQASGMQYIQAQMRPQNYYSPSTSSPASTRSQRRPQFTTYPISPYEYPTSPHHWTSVRAGLHLTRLRSPRRAPSSRDQSPGAERTRYYQYFSKFILEPIEIRPYMGVTTLEFNISQEELANLSLTTLSPESIDDEPPYEVPMSRHFNNSNRYRIRLCESRQQEGQQTFDAATWSRIPTYWPPHFFFSFNDEIIHVRRRQHFHHDLPIELTDSLVKGKNTIKVNLPYFPQNLKKNISYFMAVELVTTLNHNSVRDLVISTPHITVEATKYEISRRLQRLETDEIVIESDTLTISVADILSSKLFDIPVRGRQCRHLECIDLQNWLDSRPSKWPQDVDEPSVVDCWACPLCGMDARPCSLLVDEFFVEIKQKLLESGKGNTKKIEMRANGEWSPIEEPDGDDESSDRDGAQQK